MSKKQLWMVVAGIMFMMIWGLDLISIVKLNKKISQEALFNPFHLSQLLYGTATLMGTNWLFKQLLPAKKALWFIAGIAGLLIGFIMLRYLLEQWLYPLLIGYSNYPGSTALAYYFLDNIYYALIYVFLGAGIFIADELIWSRKRQYELAAKNREAELAFLRSQINPHFLFNSLNNIYSLSYKKSEKTTDAIMKLSELMRYMLYEKKETVPLKVEWEYVHHFITLQQLRYDYPLQTRLSMEGDAGSWDIPPYLLITILENAFKHGDFSQEKPFVLQIKVAPDAFICYSENVIGLQQKEVSGGIGLENITRRLELMYDKKQQLKTWEDHGRFCVSLQLTK